MLITNTRTYLQSDWLRVVQYWPYLHSFFNTCTLSKQEKNKQKESQYSISVAEKQKYIK